MKCLSRIEMQEYIDKEADTVTENETLMHLRSCGKCLSLYNEAIEDKALINNFLSTVVSEENSDAIPEFILPVKRGKMKTYFTIGAVLAAASLIGFILLFRLNKEQVIVQIPESEMIMYEFYEGKDLNKMWHDKSQIFIIQDEQGNVIQSTITN